MSWGKKLISNPKTFGNFELPTSTTVNFPKDPSVRYCAGSYLISVNQQDLVLGGFLFLSFGPLADSSLFSYCFRY